MKPTIIYSDFEKLDLRVGMIIEANVPEWSEKLLEFKVDFGEEIGMKTIFSGVKAWYQPEDFLGKKFIFVVNLAERKMGPSVSQGMMLMADQEDKPVPVPTPNDLQPGCPMA
ncbi:MAG: methionine--tRNA ligase [Patescibacteria group bacterium]